MFSKFGEAFGILMRTTPYVILRLLVYGAMGIGAGIYLAIFIFLAKVFGGFGSILFIIALAGLFGLLKLVKQYVLYLINAGHIAVITELVTKGRLPDGVNQVEYGKQVVMSLFKEVSVLFVVDQLVDGIVKGFNRTVVRVADLLPIPGLDSIAKIINSIIYFSVTFVDETILSYNLSRKEHNIWENAKRGVVLYAQNWKPILMGGIGIAIVNFIGAILCIGIMMIPFGLIGLMSGNETVKTIMLVLAITTGFGLKQSFVNPLCLISMILTFRSAVAQQEPNLEWESRLEQMSNKFVELKNKARDAVRSTGTPAADPGFPSDSGPTPPPPGESPA